MRPPSRAHSYGTKSRPEPNSTLDYCGERLRSEATSGLFGKVAAFMLFERFPRYEQRNIHPASPAISSDR